MIHTVYSNVYEALRAVLLHNLGMENDAGRGGAVFERRPVVVPSSAVAEDLKKSLARDAGVCAGYDFTTLSAWMGFFSREPLANIGGNEADWMIRGILAATGPGSFREAPGHERLKAYLEGKSEREVFELSRRISALFVTYASYRTDWLLAWMRGEDEGIEHHALASHPDYVWERDLWRRLCETEDWQGRQYLENFPETLVKLARAGGEKRVKLDEGRVVALPDALHVFTPFVVPPLMLPLLRAYAHSGRDIWFYLLNPSSEYWFDLLPRRLIEAAPEGVDAHRESGHPILADNARSVRANIDRLWRFTAESKSDDDTEEALRTLKLESDALDPVQLDRRAPMAPVVRNDVFREMAAIARMRPQEVEVGTEAEMQSYYLETNRPTLLHRIQDSILTLEPERAEADEAGLWLAPDDRSVQFFAAPSATREWESLAEWLHHLFRTMPGLAPYDVLVVTPDVAAAAPLVEQVFGSLPEGRRIAWKIAGAPRVSEASPAEAVRGLAALMTGRAKMDELVGWWSLPPVAERWALDAESLSTVSAWLRDAGCRYGLSDAHLMSTDGETFATAAATDMTLERALERLALGLMRPEGDKAVWKGMVPVDGRRSSFHGTADEAGLLERLARLGAALEDFRLRTRDDAGAPLMAPPAHWRRWVEDAIETFFEPADAWADVRATTEALAADIERATLRTGGDGAENADHVSFELFMTALNEQLGSGSPGGKPGNAVTITGMNVMRGIPYKVVVVVGLSEDCAFPGSTKREEFDLMASAPRRGDRDSRQDNRNVFLDLLLAAREVFAVSYVAGTGSGSAAKKPSIVAEELRSWILGMAPDADTRERGAAQLTQRIPLTATSKANFAAAAPWRATDATALEAVRKAEAAGYRAPSATFADAGVPTSAGWVIPAEVDGRLTAVVPLEVVVNYWRKPSKTVLKCWGVKVPEAEDGNRTDGMLPDTSSLAVWGYGNEALEALVRGESPDAVKARWSADPRFGLVGVREWAWEEYFGTAEKIAHLAAAQKEGWTETDPRTAYVTLPGLSWRDPERGELPVALLVNLSGIMTHPEHVQRRRVVATPSRIDEAGKRPAYEVLRHAAAVAAGEPLETVLVGPKKVKSAVETGTVTFTWAAPDGAVELLTGVTDVVLRALGSAAFMTDGAGVSDVRKNDMDRILWTGNADLRRGVDLRQAWIEFLGSLLKNPDQNPKAAAHAWRRITAKLLGEAVEDEEETAEGEN